MDYKKNSAFFIDKKNKIWGKVIYAAYLFYAVAVVSALIGSISSHGFNPNIIGALVFVIPGVIIHIVCSSMITSEKYIKSQVSKEIDIVEAKALEALDYPEQDPDKFYKMRGYDLLNDASLVRKTQDKFYSNIYEVSYLLITDKTLKVFRSEFSLTDEFSKSDNYEFSFNNLLKAELIITEENITTIDGVPHLPRVYTFRLYNTDGEIVCTLHNHEDSSDIDRLCELIAHYGEKARKK